MKQLSIEMLLNRIYVKKNRPSSYHIDSKSLINSFCTGPHCPESGNFFFTNSLPVGKTAV